jgi:uncharacterized membrane protein
MPVRCIFCAGIAAFLHDVITYSASWLMLRV